MENRAGRIKVTLLILLSGVLLVTLIIAGSCMQRLLAPEPTTIWTPAPVSGAPAFATPRADILTTRETILPTAAAPKRDPTAIPGQPSVTPLPEPTATADPHLVVITEADVVAMVTGGGLAGSGASLEGLTVRFSDGQMTLSATRLGYGGLSVSNLTLVGRLVARNGKLELVTESITPRGLVTAFVPIFANQALTQYTAQWYIEEVRTLDGRLELRIR